MNEQPLKGPDMGNERTISVLGCGWLGKPLAVALMRSGFVVSGSTTSPERLSELKAAGIRPFLIRFSPKLVSADVGSFFSAHVCVVSVPPALGRTKPDDVLLMMKSIADELIKGNAAHVILISSTSVYDSTGQVMEEDDANPTSILYRAEEIFLREQKLSTTVIRFAGLVGPGRRPSRFLSGKVVPGGNDPVNLIHLSDCIGVIQSVIHKGKWNKVYNACADLHPSRREFYTHVCRKDDVPLPEFIAPHDSAPKTISNQRLRADLRYAFEYPDPMEMTF